MLQVTISRRTLFLLLLAWVLVIPATAGATHLFSDVSDSNTHADGIGWVKDAGVTKGCTTTTYCPDDPVTRAQIGTFLYRLSGNDPATAPSINADQVDGLDSTSFASSAHDHDAVYSVLGHDHDTRYYTQAQVDSSLATKAETGHLHDDRYYTEAEVDALLAGKLDTGAQAADSELLDGMDSTEFLGSAVTLASDQLMLSAGATDVLAVSCGPGETVISGGFEKPVAVGAALVDISISRPDLVANAWEVEATNLDIVGQTVAVFALCAPGG